jgi:hypothetical protein
MTATPPAARTALAISSPSQATMTLPMADSIARRMTCTTIGTPPMRAMGLPGSRVAFMRAGMTIKTDMQQFSL